MSPCSLQPLHISENYTEFDRPQTITILYGSQTGHAKVLAELFTQQAYHIFVTPPLDDESTNAPTSSMNIRLFPMDEYKPVSNLSKENGVLVFVCSTTGYGVPPNNMQNFWKRLMHRSLIPGRSLPPSVRFAVLGLGDSSYPMFNTVAKKLYRRLIQLGASALEFEQVTCQEFSIPLEDSSLGLADDQAELGINTVLRWWIPSLWYSISKICGIALDSKFTNSLNWHTLSNPRFIASLHQKYHISVMDDHRFNDLHKDKTDYVKHLASLDIDCGSPPSNLRFFSILENKRISSEDHFQDTRLITLLGEFDRSTSSVNWEPFQPGDVICVQPENFMTDVLTLFDLIKLRPDQRLIIQATNSNFKPPSTLLNHIIQRKESVSLAWLAVYYFDLNCTPQPIFFTMLAGFAIKQLNQLKQLSQICLKVDLERLELETERLVELGSPDSPEAVDDLYDYVFRPQRRLIEILVDFPVVTSCLDATNLFNILPGPIYCRYYSIASAPPTVQLLIAVVKFQTRITKPRLGLTSNYLANLSAGTKIIGYFEKNMSGKFHFNTDAPKSIYISTGTGIAPIRSHIQYKQKEFKFPLSSHNDLLIFGCRYSDKDFYFSNEWLTLCNNGQLCMLNAFSREPLQPGQYGVAQIKRNYVQDQLRLNASLIWSFLSDPDCFIYAVCNAKTMPTEICDSLIYALCTEGNFTTVDAELYLNHMKQTNRLQIESWS